MTYSLEFSKEFERVFEKLQKKNPKQCEIILKKLGEIIQQTGHYKPLSHNLKGYRRVHIDKSFVLVFKSEGTKVIAVDYDHHDNIYKKQYR